MHESYFINYFFINRTKIVNRCKKNYKEVPKIYGRVESSSRPTEQNSPYMFRQNIIDYMLQYYLMYQGFKYVYLKYNLPSELEHLKYIFFLSNYFRFDYKILFSNNNKTFDCIGYSYRNPRLASECSHYLNNFETLPRNQQYCQCTTPSCPDLTLINLIKKNVVKYIVDSHSLKHVCTNFIVENKQLFLNRLSSLNKDIRKMIQKL